MKSSRSPGRGGGARKAAKRAAVRRPGPQSAVRASGESLRKKLELPAAFENKAGKYELIRIEGEEVYYEFTNRHGQTASRVMPVVTWRLLGERAGGKTPE